MHVFVTGATGWVGSVVVPQLIAAGHRVTGLARSDASAGALAAAGAGVLRGNLEDLDSLRRGASEADGVVHLAFIHDFAAHEASAMVDRAAIAAIADVLEGSDRPLVITSGTGLLAPGRLVTEADRADPDRGLGSPRAETERIAVSYGERGIRSSVVRLSPSVHGEGDHGFVPLLIQIARRTGVSGYVGDGSSRWPAVHRLDAARLYRLVLERAPAGTVAHGVADEGVPTRAIAEVIGRHLDLPVVSVAPQDASEHFGFLGVFFSLDIPASNAVTRERFGWTPSEIGLIEDLEQGHYFAADD